MKIGTVFLSGLIATSLLSVSLCAEQAPEQLDTGTEATSPNKRFVAVYNPDQIEIRNTAGRALDRSFTVLPVYAVRWSNDSHVLVVVQHIAHGSEALVIHFNGKRWAKSVVPPPGHGYLDYAVVDLDVRSTVPKIVYKARGPSIYVISFVVDPANGSVNKVQKIGISFEKWQSLKMVGDKRR